MDVVNLTAFISPFLPFLMKLGGKAMEKATESASGRLGETAFKKAQAIWEKLSPKVEAKEAAREAAVDVANNPNDEDLQIVLRLQLKKLLDQDAELLKLIAEIFQEGDGTLNSKIVQNVTGSQNQIIGHLTGGNVMMVIDRKAAPVENPLTDPIEYDDQTRLSPEETARRVAAFERFVDSKRQLWDSLTPAEKVESDEQFEELYKSLAESRR